MRGAHLHVSLRHGNFRTLTGLELSRCREFFAYFYQSYYKSDSSCFRLYQSLYNTYCSVYRIIALLIDARINHKRVLCSTIFIPCHILCVSYNSINTKNVVSAVVSSNASSDFQILGILISLASILRFHEIFTSSQNIYV